MSSSAINLVGKGDSISDTAFGVSLGISSGTALGRRVSDGCTGGGSGGRSSGVCGGAAGVCGGAAGVSGVTTADTYDVELGGDTLRVILGGVQVRTASSGITRPPARRARVSQLSVDNREGAIGVRLSRCVTLKLSLSGDVTHEIETAGEVTVVKCESDVACAGTEAESVDESDLRRNFRENSPQLSVVERADIL